MHQNKIKHINSLNEETKSQTLILPIIKNKDFSVDLLDMNANRLLIDTMLNEDISTNGEITVLHTPKSLFPNFNYLRIFCIGLGLIEESNLSSVRKSGGSLGRYFLNSKIEEANIFIDSLNLFDNKELIESFIEGFFLGNYSFDKYKNKKSKIDNFFEITSTDSKLAIKNITTKSYEKSEAEKNARNLVNEPANYLTPSKLADISSTISNKKLKCNILDKNECKKLGMNAFLGVSQGSIEEPKLIHLSYKPLPNENSFWYIGKAITFDSGGLSLKPSGSMFSMKGDMGGSAAVISAINAIANLGLMVNIDVLCLATENMPSGSAQRPSDVVEAMDGTYIEVENTDAEGRLTLADAITYAKTFDPKFIIDVATLTGAASIGLGKGNISAFSNNEKFMKNVKNAGEKSGDHVWQLPLDSVSKKQNNSTIADIKNTGGRLAGSITAAHFINHFVGEIPWVHLDIAANSMTSSNDGWHNKGATGIPTRLLIELAYIFEK